MSRWPYALFGVVGIAVVIGAAWIYIGEQTSTPASSTGGAAVATTASDARESADRGTTVPSGQDAAEPRGDEEPSGASGYMAQDDGRGSVSVSAVLLTQGSLDEDASLADLASRVGAAEFGIEVSFTTHSVDLSGLDLVSLSVLRTSSGPVAPLRWISGSDDSHHRFGVLVFPARDVDLGAVGELTLIMKDIAGIPERAMSWFLPKT